MGVKISGQQVAPIVKDEALERRELFISTVRDNIKRPGIEDLLKWLDATDFFIAPASTHYHGAVRGGLCAHSLAVYRTIMQLAPTFCGELDDEDYESLALVSLFHDLCKADYYSVSLRNVKNENTGAWEKQPYYAVDDKRPLGHGSKSLSILQDHIKLSLDEKLAVRWHMNAFSADDYTSQKSLSQAKSQCILLMLLILADEAASFIVGV